MLYAKENWGSVPEGWTRTHLLGLEDLSAEEITILLDLAKMERAENWAVKNLYRPFLDLLCSVVVELRHVCHGVPKFLADNLKNCAVVNAGDGTHEHPTQGLLDMLTIRRRFGSFKGLKVALVGDIAHSRVARSNIFALLKLGAQPIVCGPSTLVSPYWEEMGVKVCYSLDEILGEADVFNLLRIQFERQVVRPFPSIHEYSRLYAMNAERLARCKKDALILAPGPINRGVEITPEVADGPQSAILDQVTNGVAVRMAALWCVLTRSKENASAS